MLSAVLVTTGLFQAVCGCLAGTAAACAALVPLGGDHEATRALMEATRPLRPATVGVEAAP